MSAALVRAGRCYWLFAVALFLFGLMQAWSATVTILFVFTAAIPVLLAVPLTTVVLVWLGARSGDCSRSARIGLAIAPVAMLGATVLLSVSLIRGGNAIGQLGRLAIHARHYSSIIDRARAGEWNEGGDVINEDDGTRFYVDRGPPVRVAFEPMGMLDNWEGIVFDPAGTVARYPVDQTRNIAEAPDRIVKLFGGDLVECAPLVGDYYTCFFT